MRWNSALLRRHRDRFGISTTTTHHNHPDGGTMRQRRVVTALAIPLALAFVAASCGSDDSSGATDTGSRNVEVRLMAVNAGASIGGDQPVGSVGRCA